MGADPTRWLGSAEITWTFMAGVAWGLAGLGAPVDQPPAEAECGADIAVTAVGEIFRSICGAGAAEMDSEN